jgi:hypothetical protein
MSSQYPEIAIIALGAFDIKRDQEVLRRHFGEQEYPALVGHYKGVQENSYIVELRKTLTGKITLGDVVDLAKKWNQESVLLLDNQRGAHLIYTDDRPDDYLGAWRELPKTQAIKHDSYTYDPRVNKYFVAF